MLTEAGKEENIFLYRLACLLRSHLKIIDSKILLANAKGKVRIDI